MTHCVTEHSKHSMYKIKRNMQYYSSFYIHYTVTVIHSLMHCQRFTINNWGTCNNEWQWPSSMRVNV